MLTQPNRHRQNRVQAHRRGLWVPRYAARWPFVVTIPLVAGCVELPAPAKEQLAQAEKDYRGQNYREASNKLEDILRKYPEYKQSAEAYYLRSQVRVAQNNKLGASTDVKKCLSLSMNPDLTARAHATAGQLAFETGDFPDAAQHLEAALRKIPEKPPADLVRFRLAVCLARIGEWRKARPQFAAVYQRYPDSAVAAQAKALFEWPWDYFVIQCGAFRDQAQANRLAQKLTAAGLSARVESRPRLGEGLYTVCVGIYPKFEQAQEALRSVKGKSPGAVVAPNF